MTTIQIKDGNGNLLTVPVLPIGQQTAANSVSYVPASDLGPYSVTVSPTITSSSNTTSQSWYTSGQIVGGLLTFSNMVNASTLSGKIDSVVVTSKSTQTVGFKLYLFKTNPTNTTWTDKTTPAINSADLPYLIGVYNLDGTDDSGLGVGTIYQASSTLGAGVSPRVIVLSSTNLYGVLVTSGGPMQFTSTTDVSVTVNILKT